MEDFGPCSTEWALAQVAEYAERRADYESLGAVLERVLALAADRYAPLAIVQVRTKGIPSFAEKCLRKCHKYRRPVDQMTDLCGGRIIVHTQAQVERISRFLEESFEIDWANSEDIGKRLKTSEFGYRSVHYIVTFKRGIFPTKDFPVKVPPRLYGGKRGMANPRAEVQVRTLLEHAWADVGHDLLYKGSVDAPEAWRREYARLAAMLETADAAMSRVHGNMGRFVSTFNAYMTRDQMVEELDLLRFVREHDPKNVGLALRIAGVACAAEKWDVAIDALRPFESSGDPSVLRELGIAYCGEGRGALKGAIYRRGQNLLQRSSEDRDEGASALLRLAESWRGVDDDRARQAFDQAFKALPDDPHALAGYLEFQIGDTHDLSPAAAAGFTVASAIETCEARGRAGVDIPGTYFAAGFFHLLRGSAYSALDSYAKGIELSDASRQISTALDVLRRLKSVAAQLEGHAWAVRLLQVGLAARFPDKSSRAAVCALATAGSGPLTEPVLLVAGGCDPARAEQFERYRSMIVRGLSEFCGLVVSGGTREGVSGFVGEASQGNSGIHSLSYLPRLLPIDASLDPRYTEVRTIDDAGFTPMGSLQAWTDILASGIDPEGVRLLGVNGGRISAAEYRIALALGAKVALVTDSGREAAKLAPDERWGKSQNLIDLPADPASVRAFAGVRCVPLPEDLREAVARDLQAEFRKTRENELRPDEPGLAEWDVLPLEYRASTLQQADDIFAKLAVVGLEAVASDDPVPFVIPEADVEQLAELEHGRWTVERLLNGWRLGPTKDVKTRVSPYLLPWDVLPEDTREWDRAFIRAIPATLAKYGYEVKAKA